MHPGAEEAASAFQQLKADLPRLFLKCSHLSACLPSVAHLPHFSSGPDLAHLHAPVACEMSNSIDRNDFAALAYPSSHALLSRHTVMLTNSQDDVPGKAGQPDPSAFASRCQKVISHKSSFKAACQVSIFADLLNCQADHVSLPRRICHVSLLRHFLGCWYNRCCLISAVMQRALELAREGHPDELNGTTLCRHALSLALLEMDSELDVNTWLEACLTTCSYLDSAYKVRCESLRGSTALGYALHVQTCLLWYIACRCKTREFQHCIFRFGASNFVIHVARMDVCGNHLLVVAIGSLV